VHSFSLEAFNSYFLISLLSILFLFQLINLFSTFSLPLSLYLTLIYGLNVHSDNSTTSLSIYIYYFLSAIDLSLFYLHLLFLYMKSLHWDLFLLEHSSFFENVFGELNGEDFNVVFRESLFFSNRLYI
jgi:hypothetical protein